MIINYFTINLHESCVAELGLELETPESAVRHTTDCTIEPGMQVGNFKQPNQILPLSGL